MSASALGHDETKSNLILDFNKNRHLLLIDTRKLGSVQMLDPSYLRNEVGGVFDVVQFQDRVDRYQKINREIDDLSNRVIQLQMNPKWERAKWGLYCLGLIVLGSALIALGIILFSACGAAGPLAAWMRAGGAFSIGLAAACPYLGLLCLWTAICKFRNVLENLHTVQNRLADKKHIATDLETRLLESKETLRNIKESLITKNANYEQLAHNNPTFSNAVNQAKQRNLQQLASIDWLNVL